ncbi:MAG: DivIVA domain-containing protein [Anaerovoracaceae bacterium]
MITPADIEYKEFTKAVRGYKEEEVDAFLDMIIVDMEKLIRENRKLKEELEKARGHADKRVNTETSVYETLEAAKSLMNDIAASAERRAEVLLKNAELEASLITKEARESISRLTEDNNPRIKVQTLRTRYRRMLEDELEAQLRQRRYKTLRRILPSGSASAPQAPMACPGAVSIGERFFCK